VRFCDYVPDAELQALYRCTAALVSTSLMEGFGLPQLEARAAGLPVVAAANSPMIEVVGAEGRLVEGWQADAWVPAIEAATHHPRPVATGSGVVDPFDLKKPCRALTRLLESSLRAARPTREDPAP
jgi:glycosyltransferase involved in cell wall biosynthesis